MNHIEFRAWDKELKRMWTQTELDSLPMRDLKRDDLIFMQYTGETDRDGEKIFKGDIFDSWGTIFEIIFQYGSFMFNCTDKSQVKKLYPKSGVVVGNIYQNMDLIER